MPTKIIASIADASGDEATTEINVPAATSIANLGTFAVSWATALNLIIYGKIMSAVAYLKPDISALIANTGLAGAAIERQAHFVFLSLTGERVEVNIPALAEGTVESYTSDELNQSNTEVAAFLAAMLTGIAVTGGTIAPCDIAESSLANVLIAREVHKNSGKRA